jgi:hypothetical protein
MSKTSDSIRSAKAKGYSADETGRVFGPSGNLLALHPHGREKRKYLCFSVSVDGGTWPVPVHRFVAFLKYGEAALADGVHSRHLNDDHLDNRWENIGIGSSSDNMRDRCPQERRRSAQIAGRTNSLPDSMWLQIEAERNDGATYKQLTERHGIALSTLSYRLSSKARKMVMR